MIFISWQPANRHEFEAVVKHDVTCGLGQYREMVPWRVNVARRRCMPALRDGICSGLEHAVRLFDCALIDLALHHSKRWWIGRKAFSEQPLWLLRWHRGCNFIESSRISSRTYEKAHQDNFLARFCSRSWRSISLVAISGGFHNT